MWACLSLDLQKSELSEFLPSHSIGYKMKIHDTSHTCIFNDILTYKNEKLFTYGKLTKPWCFGSAPEFMWIAIAIYCALYLLEDGILCAIFDQPIYLKLDLIGKVDYSKRIFQDTIRSTLT